MLKLTRIYRVHKSVHVLPLGRAKRNVYEPVVTAMDFNLAKRLTPRSARPKASRAFGPNAAVGSSPQSCLSASGATGGTCSALMVWRTS